MTCAAGSPLAGKNDMWADAGLVSEADSSLDEVVLAHYFLRHEKVEWASL
jgi:hypothetical protein